MYLCLAVSIFNVVANHSYHKRFRCLRYLKPRKIPAPLRGSNPAWQDLVDVIPILFPPHNRFCQNPNCLINNPYNHQISMPHLVLRISKWVRLDRRQLPASTRIPQNAVIPAVCSHISRRLIRFDNQEMTAALTLLSFWQTCFSGAVWRR